VLIREPKIDITKTAPSLSGRLVTYVVDFAHNATSTATGFDVTFRDQIPTGLSYVSGSFASLA
jgi:uncharacterized repeat protein (TIGR01451 family)